MGIDVLGSGETLAGVGRWASGAWSFEEFKSPD
jgi:hypothetical protein